MSEPTPESLKQLLDPSRPVPPTIANDEEFREVYCQGYRHAMSDVSALNLDATLERVAHMEGEIAKLVTASNRYIEFGAGLIVGVILWSGAQEDQ